MSLQRELDELDRIEDRHKRGLFFEKLIAHVLEEQGFDVTVNPKAAPSRQTDLCADRDGLFFIIEAKWQQKPVGVPHVSSVQERLRKSPPDVFACIFSMSGYTKSAKKYVGNNRHPEVLPFDEAELRGMVAGGLSFSELLAQKRNEIRKNATVWFADWKPRTQQIPTLLKEPDILRIGNQSAAWWLCRTQSDEVIFARQMLDLGTNSPVSLRLSVGVKGPDDLLRTLKTLKSQFSTSGGDSFAIHQRSAGWYGSGIENFVAAISQWRTRYEQLNWQSYHHSEDLAFFETIDGGGFLCVTLKQRIGENAYLYSCYIEILISGVPVDVADIRRLCEKTGNESARFEIAKNRRIHAHHFRPSVEIEPVGVIVDRSFGEYACGLIVKNPFFKEGTRSSFEAKSLTPSSPIRLLSNTELLFCRLKDWHPSARLMDRYELQYIEGCWIENLPVLYLACSWP